MKTTGKKLKQLEHDIWTKVLDSIELDIILKFDNHVFFAIEDALRDCYEER